MPSHDELTELSDADRLSIRKACLRHLFVFCKTVMGYEDIIEDVHGELCRFLSSPIARKQATLPRSFVKTWIGTIAYSIWVALPRTSPDEFPPTAITNTQPLPSHEDGPKNSPAPANHFPQNAFVPLEGHPGYWVDPIYLLGPNIRVLVASYVIGNAMKMIGLIRKTYERNTAMMILFSDVIPESFNKVKWSDTEACIARRENFTESTFEAGGIGGSTTSRHYDIIIEDDLIYANKDDFTGQELQPSQDDIDKAIGWHKLAMSLLVPGVHTRIHNIGTRWAKHDLVDFIRTNEKDYVIFERAITLDYAPDGPPSWPTMYPKEQIRRIYQAQGPYMFATQYLCKPMAPEDMLFKMEWLSYYKTADEVPKPPAIRIFTTTDLSLWGKTIKKGVNSRGVVMTCAWSSDNHCWILRYDVARFDPSEIMDLWYVHHKLFKPELIGVEEVYYQKAILHFMRLRMEKDGWLPVRPLKTSTAVDKDVRIRALQPYALNGAIHCRPDHKDFILEYGEYVPGSDHCRKDILDALSYQLQIARPGVVENAPKNRLKELQEYTFSTNMDKVLDGFWLEGKKRGPFANHEISENQHLKEEEELDFERIINGMPSLNE